MTEEAHRPVTLSYADEVAAGTSRRRVDSRAPARPHRGVRATFEPVDYLERAHTLLPVFRPVDFFSHTTAAVLRGLPVSKPRDHDRLHVAVRPPGRAMRRPGVTAHHLWDEKVRIDHIDGIPLADPLSTFCHLGELLALEDLVAVGDGIVLRPRYPEPGDPRPFATIDELVERATHFRGRGGRRAREAAALVRMGAESRMESLLRILIVQRGLPEPRLNVELCDVDGRLVARVDMDYEEYNTVIEYDGDQHRSDKAQNEKDITRIEAIRRLGREVVRVRDAGLFQKPDDTIRAIERALRAGGWRP